MEAYGKSETIDGRAGSSLVANPCSPSQLLAASGTRLKSIRPCEPESVLSLSCGNEGSDKVGSEGDSESKSESGKTPKKKRVPLGLFE